MNLLILPKKAKNHAGKQFGRLTVVAPTGVSDKGRYIMWDCQCSCGNKTQVKSSHLVSGGVKSCGCLAREESAIRIKQIHNNGDDLYFIRCGEFVKIGRADDVQQRFRQLSASNPYDLTIIRILSKEGYREKEMHQYFQDSRVKGEWFRIHDYEVVDIT